MVRSAKFLARCFNIRITNLHYQNAHTLVKRANDIGPSATLREKVEDADEDLLAAGNFIQCPTIVVLKKVVPDYRKTMLFNEEMLTECHIIARSYRVEDMISMKISGN